MAVRLPGTKGLYLPGPTPQFRYDFGFTGGHLQFGCWIYPEDVTYNQEILTPVEAPFGSLVNGYVLTTLRLEGGFAAGTLTVISQADLFGLCSVARSVPGVIVPNQWQHVLAVFQPFGIADPHLYVDGVEVSYAFTRGQAGLPSAGGWDFLIGSTFRGIGGGPSYPCGARLIIGDPSSLWGPAFNFTTGPGASFKGGIQHVGVWHSGLVQDGPDNTIESLAAGYSPTFLNHYIEGSALSRALMMAPACYGESPTEECDPVTGIALAETIGSGNITEMEGPWVAEPCIPDMEGPGPFIPHIRLCLPFGLPTAALYSNPGNPGDLLPIVYGDFRLGGLRGPVPTTLIDKADPDADPPVTAWTYCGAWHPVVSVEKVYIGDVEQVFSLDTDNPNANIVVALSNNFQNRGPVMTITFLPDASNRMLSPEGQPIQDVSWRGRGAYDADGAAVMENAVDQFVHLLTNYGNFDLTRDFDLGSVAESAAAVNSLGYKTAFVVMSQDVTQQWLTEMLFNVMGYWRINGREQVEMHIDSGGPVPIADLAASIVAARDCIDGDDGVTMVFDKQAIVNALDQYYLWMWSINSAASKIVTNVDPVSVEAYGEIRKAVTLKGLRRAQDLAVWASILFDRQAARTRVEGATVTFAVAGSQFAHLTIGDTIAFTWPYGPTRENNHRYINEVLRIVEIALDATRGGALAIVAVDLGTYVTGPGGTRLLTPLAK